MLVDNVLKHLLRTLPLSTDNTTGPQMGITKRMQQIQAAMARQDVGVVGLYGMGGIGKSTVAKAFFAAQSKVPTFQRRVLLNVGQDAKDNVLQTR